jgi:hypothetical protein
VFLGDGSSKALQKTFCKKNHVEKFLQKIDQKSKTDFFSILFYHVFGRFLVRGVQTKYLKNKSDPGPFLASDPPTTGVTDFLLVAPWCRLGAYF